MDPDECGCISWDGENTCPHQVAVEKTCSEMAQHVAVSIGEITKENDELKNMYAYLFSHLDMLCDELTFSAILEGLQIICTIMGDDVAAPTHLGQLPPCKWNDGDCQKKYGGSLPVHVHFLMDEFAKVELVLR